MSNEPGFVPHGSFNCDGSHEPAPKQRGPRLGILQDPFLWYGIGLFFAFVAFACWIWLVMEAAK
jgi:hypothetical protein